MRMKPLSKGDICRVRLHTGEVVEAVYASKARVTYKGHLVDIHGCKRVLAWGGKPDIGNEYTYEAVRFVGPSCGLVPVGVSV